jgi:glycosyltransferase involved in cell wall biosynthesis
MNRILIDGRLLSDKPTGISRYTNEIIQALTEHFGHEKIYVLVDSEYANISNYQVIRTRLKPYNPIHYLLFSFFVYRQNFSIYYSTFYSGLFFKVKGRKQVITVHDLMYLRIKNYFSPSAFINKLYRNLFNFIVKSSLRSSNLIISVSKTTQNDLLNYFNTDSTVIGEGVNYLDDKLSPTSGILDQLKIKKDNYFLYVGNFRKQKNIPFLVDAFILSNTPYQLVLVGSGNFSQNNNTSIIFAGVLEDHEIQILYKNCLAFVLPSLYEGFGMPILEAYTAGARVISSNQGALAEFQHLGITYFSPFNLSELVFLLQNIRDLPKPTKIEIDQVRKIYSWKSQTDQIIECIESLIRR